MAHTIVPVERGPLILGLDIGGTKTAAVLGAFEGQILLREEFTTPAHRPFTAAFSEIAAHVDAFLTVAQAAGYQKPVVVSVSVGGPLDIEAGVLHSPPHLRAWGEAPLKSRLIEHFALPVWMEHDGNAGALAEFYFGAGQGARNLIFLTLGTGLGAGLIFDRHIYHGASDAAGEVGHIRIAEEGPDEYGKSGSWEGYCSAAGLVKLAPLRFPHRWDADVTARDLIAAALVGDPDAKALVEEMGRWLGKGLAVLVDILNPDTIVLGTLAVVLGDLLLAPARHVLQQESLPPLAAACRIVPAQLGPALGDIAALTAAIHAARQGVLTLAGTGLPADPFLTQGALAQRRLP